MHDDGVSRTTAFAEQKEMEANLLGKNTTGWKAAVDYSGEM